MCLKTIPILTKHDKLKQNFKITLFKNSPGCGVGIISKFLLMNAILYRGEHSSLGKYSHKHNLI